MKVRNRLDVLNDLGKFMAIFGWVTVVLSALLGVVSMGALAEGTSRQSGVVLGLLIILVGTVSGIMMAATGYIMQYMVETKQSSSETSVQAEGFDLTHPATA